MREDKQQANGERLNVFGVGVTILAERDGADGYTVSRLECGPGDGAPLHRHAETESFCVLEGELVMEVGGCELTLGRGEYCQVEGMKPHRFHNGGDAPAVVLNFSIPAGHARFFREADALFRSGDFTPANAAELSRANGIEILAVER